MSFRIMAGPRATLVASLCLSFTFVACDGDDPVTSGGTDGGGQTITPPDTLTRCEPGAVKHCGPTSCAGRMLCGEDGYWPGEEACTYPEELCDGADQDCDGLVDETFTELGDGCQYNRDECSGPGVMVCDDTGAGVTCRPTRALRDLPETCDQRDEDCDGFVDEVFPVGETCSNGVGECATEGAYVCNDSANGVTCDAAPGEPSEESCDYRDNDCDGQSDEGFLVGEVCTSAGVGACVTESIYECSNSGRGVTCPAVEGEPSDEVCDSVDNDCDGELDEAYGDGPATLKAEARYTFRGAMVSTYSYTEQGELNEVVTVSVSNPADAQTLGYTYNEAGDVARVEVSSSDEARDGIALVYTYDELEGHLLEVAVEDDAVGRVTRYIYEEGVLTEREYYETLPEEALLGFETYTYDEEGTLTSTERLGPISPLDDTASDSLVVELYSYDADTGVITAKEVSVDDELISEARYEYDEQGALVKVLTNGGEMGMKAEASRARYDLEGHILYEELDTDADGELDSSYTFTYEEGALTMVAYDVDGDGVADLDLHIIYDEAGLHVMTDATESGTTEPVLARWTYEYDEQGRAITESYDEDLDESYEQVERYTYDEAGRLATRSREPGERAYVETYSYEGEGTLATGATRSGDSEATAISYSYEGEGLMSASYSDGDELLARELHELGCWVD